MQYADLSPDAVAGTQNEVLLYDVEQNARVVTEFLDYWRWLADQNLSLPITTGHVWGMLFEGMRVGRVWSEICEDLGLPVREDW